MNYKKPFYTLKIDTVHCGYQLAINGCLVDEDRIGAPLNMEYPINQWLKNGANVLDIYHLNIRNEKTQRMSQPDEGRLTVEVRVKEFGDSESTAISRVVYDGESLPRTAENKVDFENIDAIYSSIET